MSLIFGDRQTGWDGDSLRLILARYARPWPRWCINLRCGQEVRRRKDRNGRKGWEGGLGWCANCYGRWTWAGRPEAGPPDPMTPAQIMAVARAVQARRKAEGMIPVADLSAARVARTAKGRGRQEDYCWLRETGETVEAAGARVGVTPNTAAKYEQLRVDGLISADMGAEEAA